MATSVRLAQIVAHVKEDLAGAEDNSAQLKAKIASVYPSPPLDLAVRLQLQPDRVHVLAEFKRASPSKGDIAVDVDIEAQAKTYARAGASVVSVLTERHWFKGSLDDLTAARNAVGHLDTRPLILRKDFVVSKAQVLEARAAGADTVLLMVSVLHTEAAVKELLDYSRSWGMEPLVEVVTEAEMEVALAAGARVIGINTRDLNTFVVDMTKTPRLVEYARSKVSFEDRSISMLSLSGIKTRADVVPFEAIGIRGVLVGEALMRASDPTALLQSLVSDGDAETAAAAGTPPLVKVCGVRTVAHALAAAQAGAHLIGIIMVPGTRRYVDEAAARAIVDAVKTYRERDPAPGMAAAKAYAQAATSAVDWYQRYYKGMMDVVAGVAPLVVGVFQNQSVDDVNRAAAATGVDMVQLHGDEAPSMCDELTQPCINVMHVDTSSADGISQDAAVAAAVQAAMVSHTAALVLMDSRVRGTAGGSGVCFDWKLVAGVRQQGYPVMVAGGLTPDNVAEALATSKGVGVDVSSGVETEGVKDTDKIQAYVRGALATGVTAVAAASATAAAAAHGTTAAGPGMPAPPGMMRRQVTDPVAAATVHGAPAPVLGLAPVLGRQPTDIEHTQGPVPSTASPIALPDPVPLPAATLFGAPTVPAPATGSFYLHSATLPSASAAASGSALPAAKPLFQRQAMDPTMPPPPPTAAAVVVAQQAAMAVPCDGLPAAAPLFARQVTDPVVAVPADYAMPPLPAHTATEAQADDLPAAAPLFARQVTDPLVTVPVDATMSPPPAGHAPGSVTASLPAAAPLFRRQVTDPAVEGGVGAAVVGGGVVAGAHSGVVAAGVVTGGAVGASTPSTAPVLGRQPTDIEHTVQPSVMAVNSSPAGVAVGGGAAQPVAGMPTAAPSLGRQLTDIEPHVGVPAVANALAPPVMRRQPTDVPPPPSHS